MRVLDSKRPVTIAATAEAPSLVDHLSDEAAVHFDRVEEGLGSLSIPFRVEPRLVRGLDYYTHTTFEFRSGALDTAQNTIGGGGRYDGLVAELGGDPTPGIGFGSGIERVLLTCDAEGVFGAPDVAVTAFVVDVTGGAHARDLVAQLRRAGIATDRAYDGGSMKSQMKRANRSGAAYGLIIGSDEVDSGAVTVRDLRGDEGQQTVPRTGIVEHLRALLYPQRHLTYPKENHDHPISDAHRPLWRVASGRHRSRGGGVWLGGTAPRAR